MARCFAVFIVLTAICRQFTDRSLTCQGFFDDCRTKLIRSTVRILMMIGHAEKVLLRTRSAAVRTAVDHRIIRTILPDPRRWHTPRRAVRPPVGRPASVIQRSPSKPYSSIRARAFFRRRKVISGLMSQQWTERASAPSAAPDAEKRRGSGLLLRTGWRISEPTSTVVSGATRFSVSTAALMRVKKSSSVLVGNRLNFGSFHTSEDLPSIRRLHPPNPSACRKR